MYLLRRNSHTPICIRSFNILSSSVMIPGGYTNDSDGFLEWMFQRGMTTARKGPLQASKLRNGVYAVQERGATGVDIYERAGEGIFEQITRNRRGQHQRCYLPHRLQQLSGTCFFNASLNALLISRYLPALVAVKVMEAVARLPLPAKKHVLFEPLSLKQCPVGAIPWHDVLRLMLGFFWKESPSAYIFEGVPTSALRSNFDISLHIAAGFRHAHEGGWPDLVFPDMCRRMGISLAGSAHECQGEEILFVASPNEKHYHVPDGIMRAGSSYRLCGSFVETENHAMYGTFCKNEAVIYDSNDRVYHVDWRVPSALQRLAEQPGWFDGYGKLDSMWLIYVNISRMPLPGTFQHLLEREVKLVAEG